MASPTTPGPNKGDTGAAKTAAWSYKSCHPSPALVWEGANGEGKIYCGRESDVKDAITAGASILVPLHDLTGSIWRLGFRGFIYYVPIDDFSVLPMDVLLSKSEFVADCVKKGHTVSVSCMGGHGRTGYFTCAVLFRLGVEDPIAYLRSRYCDKVVETDEQVVSLAAAFEHPEWCKHKGSKTGLSILGYGSSSVRADPSVCFHCKHLDLKNNLCLMDKTPRKPSDPVCGKFAAFSPPGAALADLDEEDDEFYLAWDEGVDQDCDVCSDSPVAGLVLLNPGEEDTLKFSLCTACQLYTTAEDALEDLLVSRGGSGGVLSPTTLYWTHPRNI